MVKRVNKTKFINNIPYRCNIAIKGFIIERQLWRKTWELFKYLIEVSFTGFVFYYSLTHFNWVSMGIIIAMLTYYIEWFVKLIKEK